MTDLFLPQNNKSHGTLLYIVALEKYLKLYNFSMKIDRVFQYNYENMETETET